MAIENVASSLGLSVVEYNGYKTDMLIFLFREGREPTEGMPYHSMVDAIVAADRAVGVFVNMRGPFDMDDFSESRRTGKWLTNYCTHILAVLGAMEGADEPRSD